jgi:DNA-binding LacI/PurR family transcriptional regulator
VAQLAGVSQATVSLVLSGRDAATGRPISAETRRRVLDAARSLGYVPDPAARRLAAARNNLLGVFSFTATFPTDVRHSYYPFLVGVEQGAAAQGYDLVLFTGSSSGGAEALNRVRLADGCLFLGRHAPSADLRRLMADGFPVVHVGRREEPEGLVWVGADYVSASRDVVTALAGLGHRRVLLIRESDDAAASTDRERGFLQGLQAAGLPGGTGAVFRSDDPGHDVTAERVRAWFEAGVTAFVAEETDTGAAWRALRAAVDAAGLSCPGQVSLGLLGSPPADLADQPVPLGFDIPRPALGAEAVRLLSSLIAGEHAEATLVTCTFRSGETAGAPAAACPGGPAAGRPSDAPQGEK